MCRPCCALRAAFLPRIGCLLRVLLCAGFGPLSIALRQQLVWQQAGAQPRAGLCPASRVIPSLHHQATSRQHTAQVLPDCTIERSPLHHQAVWRWHAACVLLDCAVECPLHAPCLQSMCHEGPAHRIPCCLLSRQSNHSHIWLSAAGALCYGACLLPLSPQTLPSD